MKINRYLIGTGLMALALECDSRQGLERKLEFRDNSAKVEIKEDYSKIPSPVKEESSYESHKAEDLTESRKNEDAKEKPKEDYAESKNDLKDIKTEEEEFAPMSSFSGYVRIGKGIVKSERKVEEEKSFKKIEDYNPEDRKIIEGHWDYIIKIKAETEERIFKESGSKADVEPIGFDWDYETILKYWKNKKDYKNIEEADAEFMEMINREK